VNAFSRILSLAVFASALVTPAVASAQATGSIEGFGGIGVSSLQSQPPSLGGRVTFALTPAVQVIGEAGRIGSVLPSLSSAVFSLADTDLHATAFYGEAGVRLLAAPSSKITPYVEASAGIARLNITSPRLGAIGNAAASLALTFAGRNDPVAGLGAGFLVRTGPIVFDAGYRYKQLFTNEVLRDALGFGQPLRTHQFRVGLGVRF
jgi:opacity protein-like surface antigen